MYLPRYEDTVFVNDISLLRMNSPVQFTDYVRPVCLPPPRAPVRHGRLCTLVGWGQLFEVGKIFRKSSFRHILHCFQIIWAVLIISSVWLSLFLEWVFGRTFTYYIHMFPNKKRGRNIRERDFSKNNQSCIYYILSMNLSYIVLFFHYEFEKASASMLFSQVKDRGRHRRERCKQKLSILHYTFLSLYESTQQSIISSFPPFSGHTTGGPGAAHLYRRVQKTDSVHPSLPHHRKHVLCWLWPRGPWRLPRGLRRPTHVSGEACVIWVLKVVCKLFYHLCGGLRVLLQHL